MAFELPNDEMFDDWDEFAFEDTLLVSLCLDRGVLAFRGSGLNADIVDTLDLCLVLAGFGEPEVLCDFDFNDMLWSVRGK